MARSVRWDQTPAGLKIRLFLKLSGPDAIDQAEQPFELEESSQQPDESDAPNAGDGAGTDENPAAAVPHQHAASGFLANLTQIVGPALERAIQGGHRRL